MAEPWTVAMIGCGWAARALHVPWIAGDPRLQVVELIDPVATARVEVARLLGPAYRPGEPRLHCDLTVVAGPSDTREQNVRRAVEHSRVVLVEKPLATSLALGAELADLAEANGTSLIVAHNYLHHRGVRELAARVRGPVGAVTVTHAMRSPFDGCAAPAQRWRAGSRGGCLVDLGYHALYLAEHLAGAPTATLRCAVDGRNGAVDTATITARTGSGADVTIAVSWSAGADRHRITVRDGSGEHVLDDLRFVGDGHGPAHEITAGGPEASYAEIYREIVGLLDDPDADPVRPTAALRVSELLDAALVSALGPDPVGRREVAAW